LKISNNVSHTYLIIVAKFQINSTIIFKVTKTSLMPRAYYRMACAIEMPLRWVILRWYENEYFLAFL